MTSALTHTLDQFVEPHVSEDHDFTQDEQLRTKKNCPQMALFLAFNGDKNCKKPVYHNFHAIELNGKPSNEDPSSNLNQLDIPPPISDIDDVQILDHNIGNYLMDKLFQSGEIVPKNDTSDQERPTGVVESKDEIDHKYEELMSAMHLVLEKMGASKETKQADQLDQHTDVNKYGTDPDVPQTVTDEYGPIIELPKSKSAISKNRNNYRPELDKPIRLSTKFGSSETTQTEPKTIQAITGDEPDEEDFNYESDLTYEEDPKDWADYLKVNSNNGIINKNRDLGKIMTKIQDQLKKCLGISCECTKDRDFPAEGNDNTLVPQTPYHPSPTQRYKRPRSDGNRKNISSSHDSFSQGIPMKLNRLNRRTESPSQNHLNSNYFDSSDKDGDREEYVQKKSIPFATEIIPGRHRGSNRKETNSIALAPVDEEWSEENMDDFLEKFNRIINKKSKEEIKTNLRSKSQASKMSFKEEDELKMDLAQKLAQMFFSAKRKIARNKIRAITKSPVPPKPSQRSKPRGTKKLISISDQKEKEFLKELVKALTDEIPEVTYKGIPENEDEEDEVKSLLNLEYNLNRSNMQHFVKPNNVYLTRKGDTDDNERPHDDYIELQSREDYRLSFRPNMHKIKEADDDDDNEDPDVEPIQIVHHTQSNAPKTRTRGLLRPTVALSNQRRISSLHPPIETDEDESSDYEMEKEVVDARKLYNPRHLKSSIPSNNKIQIPFEIDVVDTEKAVLKRPNSRGSRVHPASPRPHSERVDLNFRQQQNRSKPRPRFATERLESLEDNKFKDEFHVPARTQQSRKSYEYNSKASEKLPTRPHRRIDELPDDLDEGENNIDDDGDVFNHHECLNRPSNTITHRIPRPLSSKNQQRLSSGEVKSSNELHILFNDPKTEPMDEDTALEDTEDDQPLQDEALPYFRDHRNIRRQGRTMESENASHLGNRRNGRNQLNRRGTVPKSQRQHNDRREAIVHREQRGLFDRKKLQLLGSLSDDKKSRDSNSGKAISDRITTPKTDLVIETNDLPVQSKRMFANGKKLSVIDPKDMDDQYLIYPELINEEMEFNPLEDDEKKQIQKEAVAKVHNKDEGSLENQQKNQTVVSEKPTTTVNHPQARRYLNLFNNFKERVSLVTKKPAYDKYYRGYPPGVEKYAANYS